MLERGVTHESEGVDVSAHQEQTRRLVRAMMALTGQTASGLAKAAGLTPSTVNRFMHKPVRHTLSQRTMLALMTETFQALSRTAPRALDAASLTELAPAIAIYERGILEKAPEVEAVLGRAKATAGSARTAPTSTASSDLPVVLASTRDVNVDAGDFARAPLKTQRPHFLEADPKAFAILMPDASMMPRFDAGDMLYVSPSRGLGDKADVVMEYAGGGFIVGSLIGETTDAVRVATLTPRNRETHPRAKLRGVYRIVGVQRLGD